MKADWRVASTALSSLKAWWATLPARDRRLAALCAAVLAVYFIWLLAVQPAWHTLRTAPAQRDALDMQWQGMQRLAAEAIELRGAPVVSTEQSQAALRAATERLGPQGRLSLQGERAVLTVQGASTSQLRDWLAEARSGARARPIEVRLARAAQGYTGTLVVAIGGAP